MNMAISGYTLRQLTPADWLVLKTVRLDALREERGVFGGSYANEAQQPDAHWQDRLTMPERAYFGLFTATGECVGLTAVVGHDREVDLIASYVRKPHRGKGIAGLFFNARLNWARSRNYTRAIVSHRENNLPSQAAILRHGFLKTHTQERLWPDGCRAGEVFYALRL